MYYLFRKLTKQSSLYSLLVLGKLGVQVQSQYVANVEPLDVSYKYFFIQIEHYHIFTSVPSF